MAKAKPELQPEPDAWLQLVLQTMSAEQLRQEIARASASGSDITAEELRWLKAELLKRERGKARS